MINADSVTLVHVLYIALFGRPADPVGLKTWSTLIDKLPGNAAQVTSAFNAADEAYAMFGGYSSVQKIDILFQNMFGHAPSAANRVSLAAELDKGAAGLAGLVDVITTIVSPADIAALEAKIAAASAFVGALDLNVEVLAYNGDRAHGLAHDFLAKVTDAVSLAQATATPELNTLVAKIVGLGPAPAPEAIKDQVQEMYIAFFGRAADHNGLEYWSKLFGGAPSDNVQNMIASAFGQAHEYQALFAGKNEAQVVATVYENLFGRAGESAGIEYWSALLQKGAIAVHNVVKAISEGARGSDLYAFDAKVKVAVAITNAMDTQQEIQSYVGLERGKIVHDYIATVKDPATFAAAINPHAIDALVNIVVTGIGTWDFDNPSQHTALY
ncbi:MAG: DUF4214 domain-containing protein [Massilia sp.]|nr:DUF4214 domain-containing protein [Massilia sp.]